MVLLLDHLLLLVVVCVLQSHHLLHLGVLQMEHFVELVLEVEPQLVALVVMLQAPKLIFNVTVLERILIQDFRHVDQQQATLGQYVYLTVMVYVEAILHQFVRIYR